MNRTEAMKAHEFNTGLALMALIDKAISASPELLAKDARERAIGQIADLINDLFDGCAANAEMADRVPSITN